MSTYTFLGQPSSRVAEWFDNHTFWGQLVENLENFSDSKIKSGFAEDDVYDGYVPAVGSYLSAQYQPDHTKTELTDMWTINWRVIGYNATIPEFVKYRMGSDTIYIPTVGYNGTRTTLLSEISAGTKVYSSNSFDSAYDTGLTVSSTKGSFQYGSTHESWGISSTSHGSWSVPEYVTVGNTKYRFCGHNVTLLPEAALVFKNGNSTYTETRFAFDGDQRTNIWSQSNIRTWLNANTTTQSPFNNRPELKGVLGRFPQADFLRAIISVVNKTYLNQYSNGYSSIPAECIDSNQCEHVVDKLWLLGAGQLNSTGYSPNDSKTVISDTDFDTAVFSSVFSKRTNVPSGDFDTDSYSDERKFKHYSSDGSIANEYVTYWLKSCSNDWPRPTSQDYYSEGIVNINGCTWTGVVNTALCYILPACTIG